MNLGNLWRIHGRAFVIALLVLYLPQTWIFWFAIQAPRDITLQWLFMFPVLPGGYIGAVVRVLYWNQFQEHLPDGILLICSGLFTLMLIAILTIIGARGKGWQVVAAVFGLAYGILAALGMHAAFRV